MAERGFTTRGNLDAPGGGYKRDFNKSPTGRFNIRMKRGSSSRSKSRGAGGRT